MPRPDKHNPIDAVEQRYFTIFVEQTSQPNPGLGCIAYTLTYPSGSGSQNGRAFRQTSQQNPTYHACHKDLEADFVTIWRLAPHRQQKFVEKLLGE